MRNAKDARKLDSRLMDAAKARQILEYLDDKKYDHTQGSKMSWIDGSITPWHAHMRRAFKEKMRFF